MHKKKADANEKIIHVNLKIFMLVREKMIYNKNKIAFTSAVIINRRHFNYRHAYHISCLSIRLRQLASASAPKFVPRCGRL